MNRHDENSEPMKRDGEHVVLGIWQNFPLPMISRYLGRMGWDWVILDMQHGCTTTETVYECIHTLWAAGSMPLVRTSVGSVSEVQRALDLGARGVVVPMVNSVAEAKAMAQAAKYPPLGGRSLGGDAAWHYGDDYPERANSETLLLGAGRAHRLGQAGRADHGARRASTAASSVRPTWPCRWACRATIIEHDASHRAAIARTLSACARARQAGLLQYVLARRCSMKNRDQGFDCITFKSEADLFMSAGGKLLEQLRERTGVARPR